MIIKQVINGKLVLTHPSGIKVEMSKTELLDLKDEMIESKTLIEKELILHQSDIDLL